MHPIPGSRKPQTDLMQTNGFILGGINVKFEEEATESMNEDYEKITDEEVVPDLPKAEPA